MRTFSVRCHPTLADVVAMRVQVAAEVEADWWRWRRAELAAAAEAGDWSTEQVSAARRELVGEHAGLRAAGVLRGTRGAWVLPAVREEFAARGWSRRRWRPVPPGARRGRPWGAGDVGYHAQVVLQLPDDIAEVLVRACWWTSAPAVRRLQGWYDQHGDHWRGEHHGGRRGWTGGRPSDAQLADRDRWAGQIVTTGDVLRQALHRTAEAHSVGG